MRSFDQTPLQISDENIRLLFHPISIFYRFPLMEIFSHSYRVYFIFNWFGSSGTWYSLVNVPKPFNLTDSWTDEFEAPPGIRGILGIFIDG